MTYFWAQIFIYAFLNEWHFFLSIFLGVNMIAPSRYEQLHDYLTQIIGLSKTFGLPTINQTTAATQLGVNKSAICRFINRNTKKPIKIIKNFGVKYPLEIEKWPLEKTTIERILGVVDALYFLGLPQKLAFPNPLPVLVQSINTPVVEQIVTQPYLGQLRIQNNVPQAPIVISYRGHESTKDGAGMLFDHMRIQDITRFATVTLMPQDQNNLADTSRHFASALKDYTAALYFGIPDKNLIITPPTTQNCNNLGLLVIPGRIRKIENEQIRLNHEYRVIREALNRGQPMIGVCAGSWRLYEQMFVWTKYPDFLNFPAITLSNMHTTGGLLVDVVDHSYGGGMIRLGKDTGKAVNNVEIHDVAISEPSLLKTATGIANNQMRVNSVHWKAVNEAWLPLNTSISARAVCNPTIVIKTRCVQPMRPQEGSVEAFESHFGAPILGIQWHPEGYNGESPHNNLLKYMALAGNAYAAKRQMLEQLQNRFSILISPQTV